MSGMDKVALATNQIANDQAISDSLGDRTDTQAIQIRNAAAADMAKAKLLANFGEAEFETEITLGGLATKLAQARG